MNRRPTALGLLAAVLLAAGCTATGGDDSAAGGVTATPGAAITTSGDPVGSPGAATGASGTAASPGEAGTTVTDQVSSAIGGSADAVLLTNLYVALDIETAAESAWALESGPSEASIGECMSAAGFTYAPAPLQPAPWFTMPPEEFAARYGFGIAAYRLGLIGTSDDPNAEARAAMSPAEQAAFEQAYRSCLDSAPLEHPERVLGPGAVAMSAVVDRFRATVDADGRVVAALAAWRDCMAAAGFTYDSPAAMTDEFGRREARSEAELQALLADEIVVATVNVGCVEPYTSTYRAVVADRFAEFQVLYDTALATGATPAANG